MSAAAVATLLSAPLPATVCARSQASAADWTWGPVLPAHRTAFGCCAAADSIVTVGGTYWTHAESGEAKKQWSAAVNRLPSPSDRWESLPDYPVPVGYALVVYLDGHVYVAGGQNDAGPIAETHWLPLANGAGSWQPGPPLPRPLSRLRGGAWGRTIVAVSDEPISSDSSGGGSKVIAWNTQEKDGVWREIGSVPQPTIGYRAAAIAGDRLFVFGGATPDDAQRLHLSDKVWSNHLANRTWRLCTPLPWALRDATAVKLNNRYIAIAGGVEEAAGPAATPDKQARIILSTRCLIYDSMDDQFMVAEPLRLAVADHGMAALNGRLYVIGGEDSPYRTRTDLVQTCDVDSLLGPGSSQAVHRGIRSLPITKVKSH